MKVKFSNAFIKASRKLSGKMLDSVRRVIREVKEAENLPTNRITRHQFPDGMMDSATFL